MVPANLNNKEVTWAEIKKNVCFTGCECTDGWINQSAIILSNR